MRVKQLGCYVRVTVTARDVEAFKAQWPCSGLGARGFSAEFETRSGDLVGLSAPASWDGPALAALVSDAQQFARLELEEGAR